MLVHETCCRTSGTEANVAFAAMFLTANDCD
jgi:hypothetical protein